MTKTLIKGIISVLAILILIQTIEGKRVNRKGYSAQKKYKKWIAKVPSQLPLTQYVSIVVISEQIHHLFKNGELISSYTVSTGSKKRYKGDRSMEEGVWRLGKRLSKNLKPIYGARLIYMEKYNPQKKIFRKTNLALHGTNEPQNLGNPTSMGCVYHHDNDIIQLYKFLPEHSLVITVKE